jgi:5-methylcytosine-specific restriction endonuclease McrA
MRRHNPAITHLKRVRDVLRREQAGRCYYCAQTFLDIGRDHPRCCTFDHIILAIDGGAVSLENGVAACKDCNWLRGDMPFDEFCKDIGVDPDKAARNAYLKWCDKY